MQGWIIAGVVIGIVLLAAAVLWIRALVFLKKGVYYRSKVKGVLRRYCALRRYRLLEDVKVPADGQVIDLELVVVGIFGVLVLQTFEHKADLYADSGQTQWTYTGKDGRTVKFENPIERTDEAFRAVRMAFSKHGIYNINLEQALIFPHKKKMLYVSDKFPIVRLKKLGQFLDKDRFHEERGVDMDKISEILLSLNSGEKALRG